MNTIWGPYKISGAASLRIKDRRQHKDSNLLPTIAEHSGTEPFSLKSFAAGLKLDWSERPESPDTVLERADSNSPGSSGTSSDKSDDMEECSEESELGSPTSPLPKSAQATLPASESKSAIWSPAPVSVQPFSPQFWSSLASPAKPSPWASLDSPPASKSSGGLWSDLPSPPQSPEPLPLSPITTPSSSPPARPSIFASVPNNAPSSRSLEAPRVPVIEREFSFKLGVPTAEPLPAASDKHFSRSVSLAPSQRSSFAERISRSLSIPHAHSAETEFSQSPRVPKKPLQDPPIKVHHWCWRCGKRADLATKCLVCIEDFAVCRSCAHERAAKGRRPDTCLCAGCMSKPIDPAVIERIQSLMSSKGATKMRPQAYGSPSTRPVAKQSSR